MKALKNICFTFAQNLFKMRFLYPRTLIFGSLFLLSLSAFGQAQSTGPNTDKPGQIKISQPARMDALLEIKKSYNQKEAKKLYRIQIYNGSLQQAEKVKQEFTSKYDGWATDISFETPNYKVRVGRFRTRLEADRNLQELKKDYPSAFLLSPQDK